MHARGLDELEGSWAGGAAPKVCLEAPSRRGRGAGARRAAHKRRPQGPQCSDSAFIAAHQARSARPQDEQALRCRPSTALRRRAATPMADLVRSLPAPQREYVVWQDPDKSLRKAPTPKSRAPPYGRRRGFVPRSIADFGDGGAFPEIHVAQYPLGMGTKEDKAAQQKGGVVALEVGEDGSVRYDAIVKQGANKNRIVQTSLKDTKR